MVRVEIKRQEPAPPPPREFHLILSEDEFFDLAHAAYTRFSGNHPVTNGILETAYDHFGEDAFEDQNSIKLMAGAWQSR